MTTLELPKDASKHLKTAFDAYGEFLKACEFADIFDKDGSKEAYAFRNKLYEAWEIMQKTLRDNGLK